MCDPDERWGEGTDEDGKRISDSDSESEALESSTSESSEGSSKGSMPEGTTKGGSRVSRTSRSTSRAATEEAEEEEAEEEEEAQEGEDEGQRDEEAGFGREGQAHYSTPPGLLTAANLPARTPMRTAASAVSVWARGLGGAWNSYLVGAGKTAAGRSPPKPTTGMAGCRARPIAAPRRAPGEAVEGGQRARKSRVHETRTLACLPSGVFAARESMDDGAMDASGNATTVVAASAYHAPRCNAPTDAGLQQATYAQEQELLKWATYHDCVAYVRSSGAVPPERLAEATTKGALFETAR